MKRDIRALFKAEDLANNVLPDNHRDEFLKKLKASEVNSKQKKTKFLFYKIAASVLLFISIGYFVTKEFIAETEPKTTLLVAQIEAVEKQYLTEIDKEWQSFLSLTKDDKLVKRYKQKLENLDTDYKTISKAFKNDTSNILVIEDLIENLKIRLQLLKDIQEHIKLLNSKNENYETTI